MNEEILIVDDERDIRSLIALTLEDEGYRCVQAANAEQARELLTQRPPSAVILDIWMRDSDMDGLQLLSWCRSIYPELQVVMISGHGTVATAVQAIRQGAYDFVEKPFKAERLLLTLRRALQASRLAAENEALKSKQGSDGAEELIGQSALMKQLRQQAEKVAPTSSRVFIEGSSGSGKETLARLIHQHSPRADGPFVVAACGRLTPESADIALFGAEQLQNGRRVVGLFERAHRGTLYFDEICDLPPETQRRMVRAIAEQRFRRAGSTSEVEVDVRVISASSRQVRHEVDNGTLREDLFYRLAVVQLDMPDLSQRREDIALLARHFVKQQSTLLGRPPVKLGEGLLNAMRAYHWPGSVRQLRNVIETMLILAPHSDEPLSLQDLPKEIVEAKDRSGISQSTDDDYLELGLREARELFERGYLASQLERFDGNVSKMAQFVGMERTALHRKLKSLGIEG